MRNPLEIMDVSFEKVWLEESVLKNLINEIKKRLEKIKHETAAEINCFAEEWR